MKLSPSTVLIEYFYHFEKEKADEVYLNQPFGDSYRSFTWGEVGNQARRLANYLKQTGLPAKSNIGLVSKNCAEWVIADMAITMAGHVSVPFYPTLIGNQIKQVVEHSECQYLFVGKLDVWEDMKPGIPSGVQCISFPTYNPDPSHLQWNDLLEKYEPLKENHVPQLDDLLTILYTSGTTGNPKGVMVSNRALAEGLYNTREFTKYNMENPRFFSYLPLCHVAERNIVESLSIAAGGTIFFAESLESFAKNLQTASPTHFLAVPRIWTKFQLGILAKMNQKKLNTLLRIPIINTIIKKKIRTGLGLKDAKVVLTGAAPMPVSLLKWYKKLDIVIQEAYGMTENLGAVCSMPSDAVKYGSVGKLYPGMEVSIEPDTGEIFTRSAWNMDGYFKEPTLTAETIDKDGWIHTGDVGELDSDNYLKITGRVKEMYKTSKGEYVAPAQIEFSFAENNNIEQICIVGQHLPQPIALINLSEIGEACDMEELKSSLAAELTRINPTLKSYERVKKVIILKEKWSIENNMITPSMKIKRAVIEKKYNDLITDWYESKDVVILH